MTMAGKSVDAVSSFATLLDNLPQWTEQVSNLVAHTTRRHEEFRAEYSRLVHKAKPRHKKTDSVCSIHTRDDHVVESTATLPSTVNTPPDLAHLSPLEAGNRYIYAQANKKRKPGTSFRSGASGPMRFRSKQMVVIYFDSEVQDQLETLVKNLGACRNNLRKGKMSYSVSKGLQLPGFRRGSDYRSTSGTPYLSSVKPQSTPALSTKTDGAVQLASIPSGEAAFISIDKELETCQNLCETAAHQFLRDGDCRLELETVLRALVKVQELAQTTHESLKYEDEEQKKAERMHSSSNSINTNSDSTLVDKPSREDLEVLGRGKLGPTLATDSDTLRKPRPSLGPMTSAPLLTTEIEVDDDSDADSIEIDMNNFRMNRSRPTLRI